MYVPQPTQAADTAATLPVTSRTSTRQAVARLVYRAIVLAVVIIPLAATGLAIWLLWNRAVSWRDLILLAAIYSVVALGVTVGYHRMLTHRSFAPESRRQVHPAGPRLDGLRGRRPAMGGHPHQAPRASRPPGRPT